VLKNKTRGSWPPVAEAVLSDLITQTEKMAKMPGVMRKIWPYRLPFWTWAPFVIVTSIAILPACEMLMVREWKNAFKAPASPNPCPKP